MDVASTLATRRVSVIGLGLIGGSLAAALRAGRVGAEVRAFDRDADSLRQAREAGLIDRACATLAEAVTEAELVVIAVPTGAVAEVLAGIREHAPAGVTITDVASVKGSVLRAAAGVWGQVPPRLVPGHPIAGSERSGVGAAQAALFHGRRVILTPEAATDPQAVAEVAAMWEAVGAEVVRMSAAEHDRVLALTSHLPHMLAFALVDALAAQSEREDIFRFAAGGFRDFTRIASSDAVMWRDIALANREHVLEALARFGATLEALRGAVERADARAIEELFRRARGAREHYLRLLEQDAGTPSGEPECR